MFRITFAFTILSAGWGHQLFSAENHGGNIGFLYSRPPAESDLEKIIADLPPKSLTVIELRNQNGLIDFRGILESFEYDIFKLSYFVSKEFSAKGQNSQTHVNNTVYFTSGSWCDLAKSVLDLQSFQGIRVKNVILETKKNFRNTKHKELRFYEFFRNLLSQSRKGIDNEMIVYEKSHSDSIVPIDISESDDTLDYAGLTLASKEYKEIAANLSIFAMIARLAQDYQFYSYVKAIDNYHKVLAIEPHLQESLTMLIQRITTTEFYNIEENFKGLSGSSGLYTKGLLLNP
jgi:hypothetical protein